MSLLKVTFFASGNILWNTFGRFSQDFNEKLACTFFNVQMISAFVTFISSYTKLSIVLIDDCTVSSTVFCCLLALSLDWKKVFSFGWELSYLRWMCFFPFIWLTKVLSPIFDKANLFFGWLQTLHFANFESSSANQSLYCSILGYSLLK